MVMPLLLDEKPDEDFPSLYPGARQAWALSGLSSNS
jgi:hypothetical protein